MKNNKKKKSLVGWARTNWIKSFKFFVVPSKQKGKTNEWIYRLKHSYLDVPSITRNNRFEGTVHLYPGNDKAKKVRITIEEV